MAENVPVLSENTKCACQGSSMNSKQENAKGSTNGHSIVKLLKVKDKEKLSKAGRGKISPYLQEDLREINS